MSTFTDKAPKYVQLLMDDFGLKDFQASGIMGNLGHESGGLRVFQERKPRGGRGGLGWAQWTGVRRREFEEYCARNHLNPKSDKANYGWLFVELKGPEKGAIDAVKRTRTLMGAVQAFERHFERAGVKHYPSRYRYAKLALDAYHESRTV